MFILQVWINIQLFSDGPSSCYSLSLISALFLMLWKSSLKNKLFLDDWTEWINQLANKSKKLSTNLIAFSITEKKHLESQILKIWDFSTTPWSEDGKLSKLYFLTCRQVLSGDAKSSAATIIFFVYIWKLTNRSELVLKLSLLKLKIRQNFCLDST